MVCLLFLFNKKFYLCRDRYGIKPVYYHITEDKTFIYASEIKSILEYKSEVDKEALHFRIYLQIKIFKYLKLDTILKLIY